MQLHITNLGGRITEDSLWATFAAYGTVDDTRIISSGPVNGDRGSFAFINMPDAREASAAMQKVDGSIIDGRQVTVAATQHHATYRAVVTNA